MESKDQIPDHQPPLEINDLIEKLQNLELEIKKIKDSPKSRVKISTLAKGYLKRIFCRQNLELFLSVSALVISLITAVYMLRL